MLHGLESSWPPTCLKMSPTKNDHLYGPHNHCPIKWQRMHRKSLFARIVPLEFFEYSTSWRSNPCLDPRVEATVIQLLLALVIGRFLPNRSCNGSWTIGEDVKERVTVGKERSVFELWRHAGGQHHHVQSNVSNQFFISSLTLPLLQTITVVRRETIDGYHVVIIRDDNFLTLSLIRILEFLRSTKMNWRIKKKLKFVYTWGQGASSLNAQLWNHCEVIAIDRGVMAHDSKLSDRSRRSFDLRLVTPASSLSYFQPSPNVGVPLNLSARPLPSWSSNHNGMKRGRRRGRAKGWEEPPPRSIQ